MCQCSDLYHQLVCVDTCDKRIMPVIDSPLMMLVPGSPATFWYTTITHHTQSKLATTKTITTYHTIYNTITGFILY